VDRACDRAGEDQFDEGGSEPVDAQRTPDLVGEKLDGGVGHQATLGSDRIGSPQEAGAHDRRGRIGAGHESFRSGLGPAVFVERTHRIGLDVGPRRRAVENNVG